MAYGNKDNNNQPSSAGFVNITLNLPVKGSEETQPVSISAPVKHENVLKFLLTLSEDEILKLMTVKSVNSSTSKLAEIEFGA